jgi:hypothetical protein
MNLPSMPHPLTGRWVSARRPRLPRARQSARRVMRRPRARAATAHHKSGRAGSRCIIDCYSGLVDQKGINHQRGSSRRRDQKSQLFVEISREHRRRWEHGHSAKMRCQDGGRLTTHFCLCPSPLLQSLSAQIRRTQKVQRMTRSQSERFTRWEGAVSARSDVENDAAGALGLHLCLPSAGKQPSSQTGIPVRYPLSNESTGLHF